MGGRGRQTSVRSARFPMLCFCVPADLLSSWPARWQEWGTESANTGQLSAAPLFPLGLSRVCWALLLGTCTLTAVRM